MTLTNNTRLVAKHIPVLIMRPDTMTAWVRDDMATVPNRRKQATLQPKKARSRSHSPKLTRFRNELSVFTVSEASSLSFFCLNSKGSAR